MRLGIALIALAVGLVSCGGTALTTPEDLAITTYKKDTPFTLTVVMAACADTCATYETPTCEVEVESGTIRLSVEVSYEHKVDQCTERCAGQVLAHCEIGALPAGTYTIESGSFRKTINVI